MEQPSENGVKDVVVAGKFRFKPDPDYVRNLVPIRGLEGMGVVNTASHAKA